MRIVIDLQASQSNRNRDGKIGKASLAVSRAIAENAGVHEIWIALNGCFPETIEPLRASFEGLLTQDRIRVWRPPAPVSQADRSGERAGEFIYEAFLASLAPDAVLITSLFEGFDDCCFTSIASFERQPYLACVLLHEIVPVRIGDCKDDPIFKNWREKKLGHLRRADLCFTISGHERESLIEEFGFAPRNVIDIVAREATMRTRSIQLLNEGIQDYLATAESTQACSIPEERKLAPTKRLGPSGSSNPAQSICIIRPAVAKATLAAIEDALRGHAAMRPRLMSPTGARKRLAYVSPIPPLSSGIADYSGQLVSELCRHYDIDVVTTVPETNDPRLQANCRLKSPAWFDRNAHLYDRTIYHIGNSAFHNYMFGLLERHPGVVVLHDFYLGHVMALPMSEGTEPLIWRRLLRDAHGYRALAESFDPATQRGCIWKYPVNLDVLHNAAGIIVHSEYSRELSREWYGTKHKHEWRIIPLVRRSPTSPGRQPARARLGYRATDYLVCSFGGVGESKQNKEALLAWSASALANDSNCYLVFVGWKGGGDYADLFNALISKSPKSRIRVTDTVDAATYNDYLSAADCAIQLRTLSRGETSAAVLDCMAHGLPVIVNANGSMKELPAGTVSILKDDFTVAELTNRLEELYRDPQKRRLLGQAAADHVQRHHCPRKVADLYFEAIEDFFTGPQGLESRLVLALGDLAQEPRSTLDWLSIAQSINHNHRHRPIRRRIFIDVTEVAKNDLKTGIERVVRNTLNELLRVSTDDYLITPVYFDPKGYWRHATSFVSRSFMSAQNIWSDDVVDIREGDIFFMLDLTYHSLLTFFDKFVEMRNDGVRIYVCVYDILPIKFPHYFPSDAYEVFSTRFHKIVSVADGLICISKTVADEVHDYLCSRPISRHRPLSIGWFHLGADLMSKPVEMDAIWKHEYWLSLLSDNQTLLMVGTVEPRKGHEDVLGAFERLWSNGTNINLVICGKQGWMVEDLSREIRQHPEFEKRLFWFEGASDSTLDKLYRSAAGVLVASRGEGFGLPLVEAALHGCPILARDLPVFREVAGDSAVYFSGGGAEMAEVIENWLASIRAGAVPDPKKITPISWGESANQLLALIISDDNPRWAHKISPNQLLAARR